THVPMNERLAIGSPFERRALCAAFVMGRTAEQKRRAAVVAGFMVVCAASTRAVPAQNAGSQPASGTLHPRILISYDMEGVSGALTPDYVLADKPTQYAIGRKSLTSDVNAAIRGLVKGGAGSIWVQDAHGSGNVYEPDLLVSEMDPHASFDFR